MNSGKVESGWNLQNDVRSISHFFTNEVIPDIDRFGVLVVHSVASQINGILVVLKDWVDSFSIPNCSQHLFHKHKFINVVAKCIIIFYCC